MNYQYEPLGDEYQFQTFLKDLFNCMYQTNTFEEYASKGYAQFGVDIYSPELKIAVQAKKKNINRSKKELIRELTSDVKSTVNLIENFPHEIAQVFFATTTSRFIEIQDACISQSRTLKFFSWQDMQEEIAKYPSVRNKYFPNLKENDPNGGRISKEIKDQLEVLEKLLSKQAETSPINNKVYRDIPECDILLPKMELESQKFLIAFILKTAAYQTFASVKYKKFNCLINFSSTYTQFHDGTSAPGFAIISGEVIFLGNCVRLVKMLQHNSKKFWNLYDELQSDSDFKRINFRMELIPSEDLRAYGFEVDGQTGFYNFKPLDNGALDYEQLNSLNSVIPFIASTTKFGIRVIDMDKIEGYPAFTKFLYCCLIEDKFNPSSLKVNVNDFDDWDFSYSIPGAD
jgi:hypothetical protein